MSTLPPVLRRVELATATRTQTERANRTAISEQRRAIRAALAENYSTTEIGKIANLSRQRVNLCRNA